MSENDSKRLGQDLPIHMPSRFSFGEKVDAVQKQVILNSEGPMLVVAGPGAGKTATMVKRIAYLVLEHGIAPEHIMVVTFSRKAAKELLTRISDEFAGLEPPVNVEKMRIGTFHALCLEILSEYADRANLKSFTVIEDFDQKFMVQNGRTFAELRDARIFRDNKGAALKPWDIKYAERFVECSNTLAEECVSLDLLARASTGRAADLARFIAQYRETMTKTNRLDYADIQTRVLDLFENNPDVLEELQREIRYIIVDEYQDTNFIQEQIVLLLAGPGQNICVVGDDDQSLYRFRGATVQNILQFEDNFEGECKRIDLVTNYRSQSGIVELCKQWMALAPGYENDPSWKGCRYDKDIRPNPKLDPSSQKYDTQIANPVSVMRYTAEHPSEWQEGILRFIENIRQSPDFKNLNQIAFLCNSVKSPKVRNLIRFLEEKGVHVNAPRANMFFEREEVRSAVGCLIRCFPSCDNLGSYDECRAAADTLCAQDAKLADWIERKRAIHAKTAAPEKGFDYAFSGLLFQMMRFHPFSGWLDQSDSMTLDEAAAGRNLSLLVTTCTHFESAENYPRLRASSVESMPKRFFSKYLRGIIDNKGLEEYEDEREYAPEDCVSFMTVHQAKGMEFPVVVVCSLQDEPWGSNEPLVDAIRSLNRKRKELEPAGDRDNFDFWRKYYTAFSRAQDLLVLTSCNEALVTETYSKKDPSAMFADMYQGLPEASTLDFKSLHLRNVKPASIMRTFSFTSDVAAYQACPRRYKLFHELNFPRIGNINQGMLFGTLVHQCIEDIHRIVKRRRDAGEDTSRLYIPPDDVKTIVSANRVALERSENAEIKSSEGQVLRQIMKYLKHSKRIWRDVVEPEATVSEIRDGFVLKGVIDLIHGSDDCVEIVDFKTGRIPAEGSQLLDKYRRQMLVYAHLVRTQLGCEVSGAKLYFTSDVADSPVVDVPVTERDVTDILAEFDATVADIEAREFSRLAEDPSECIECSFAGYCGRTNADNPPSNTMQNNSQACKSGKASFG